MGIPAGNTYDKYSTTNPVARVLMSRFLSDFDDLVALSGCRSVTEFGCGEGHLARRLAGGGLTVVATDASPEIIEEAERLTTTRRRPEFSVADLLSDELDGLRSDLLVCCEVLEHVSDPSLALEKLKGLEPKYLLASVPREPLWRLLNVVRFRYLSDFGNTPGHVQHWSKRGFRDLIEKHFSIVEMRQPLPWSMVLARPRVSHA